MLFIAKLSTRMPGAVLLVALLFTVLSGYLAVTKLGFTSDTTGLIEQDEPFRVHYDAFKIAFPQLVQTILLVVDADDPATLDETSEGLIAALRREPELFPSVFLAEQDPFFKRNGLLFLDIEELEQVVEKLAEAQPALTTIAANPSLTGLLRLFELGLDALEDGNDIPPGFAKLADEIALTAQATQRGAVPALQWTNTLLAADDAKFRHVILVQPRLDLSSSSAGRAAVKRIRTIASSPPFAGDPRITIRTTGRVALSYDELKAVQEGVELAGVISLFFVAIVLGFFLRSIKLIVANFLTLIVGLIWTLGFAALAIGHLNMLSAAFAVLFIGLGIDHAIHFSMRYSEALAKGVDSTDAIGLTASGLVGPLTLCSISSAIGFASFLPTDYKGLAELGVIAAGGMGFALLATMTVLPAAIIKTNISNLPTMAAGRGGKLTQFVDRFHKVILMCTAVALVLAIVPASQMKFDFSTLAIKDRSSESVSTLIDLQESGDATDYTANIIASRASAEALAEELKNLAAVSDVETPNSLVPKDQDIKLDIIGEAADFLWTVFRYETENLHEQRSGDDIVAFRQVVADFNDHLSRSGDGDSSFERSLHDLSVSLSQILDGVDAQAEIVQLEDAIIPAMTSQLERLTLSLSAEEIAFRDIPEPLRQQFVAVDGRARIVAKPESAIVDVTSLNAFIDAVHQIAPDATGRPAVEAGVGRIVTRSLFEAALYAICAIFILLALTFRSPQTPILIIVPLVCATAFTVATASFIGLTFNFANVIVLPLIFGLGVDSGIHLVTRRREEKSVSATLDSSTPRAVMLSAMTTIGAFASLSLSPHAGTASMGVLLTISLFWIVIGTVIILPALLKWQEGRSMTEAIA